MAHYEDSYSPGWESLHYLDHVRDQGPELAGEIVGGLMERTSAARGALVLAGGGEPARVVAAMEEGRPVDPQDWRPPVPLDSIGPPDGTVVQLGSGTTVAIPLRAVIRDAAEDGPHRRRYDAGRVERTLGYVLLDGESLDLDRAEPEIRVASTLGSLLVATADWSEEALEPPAQQPWLIERIVEEELALAQETDTPLGLVALEWEDPPPEREGLFQIERAIAAHLRSTDLVLRSGRSTYLVLLPATDLEGAEIVADRLVDWASREWNTVLASARISYPEMSEGAGGLLAELGDDLMESGLQLDRVSLGFLVSRPRDVDRLISTMAAVQALTSGSTEEPLDTLMSAVVSLCEPRSGGILLEREEGYEPIRMVGEGTHPDPAFLQKALCAKGRRKYRTHGLVTAWKFAVSSDTSALLWVASPLAASRPAIQNLVALLVDLFARLQGAPSTSGTLPRVDRERFQRIVGQSTAMNDVFDRMDKVLASRVTVLLVGETGTGKELIARAIHDASDRSDGPFVTVDCGALPPTLADSELFGHRKGAFTDAASDKQGLIERAEGGTLFLDEITSMGPDIQARLLRFLQEGEVRRVGQTDYKKVDVRVIAASNHDPMVEVEEGRLRLDLYHRLQGMMIRVPSLRERREDIPALAAHFLRTFSEEEGGASRQLGSDALAVLLEHDWPGNVRELENAIRAAALVAEDLQISLYDLPEQLARREEGIRWREPMTNEEFKEAKDQAVAEITRRFLHAALTASGGNVSTAARDTGLQRTYLHRLMRQYGVDPSDFKTSS